MSNIITLLTDFGSSDSYVAQMKGILLSRAAACQIVDITHEIPPQDIRRGAYVLREAALWFPAGSVHLAVVDPGVGTARRLVAVEIERQRFVLPDNGLLSGLLDEFPVSQACVLANQSLWLSTPSRTFHGRDIMAPVAAFLAAGGLLSEVGPPAGELLRLDRRLPRDEGSQLVLDVTGVDHFGNLLTNGSRQTLTGLEVGTQLQLESEGRVRVAAIVDTYANARPGELVALVGSQGYLELAVVNGSASQALQLRSGDSLRIIVNNSGIHEAS